MTRLQWPDRWRDDAPCSAKSADRCVSWPLNAALPSDDAFNALGGRRTCWIVDGDRDGRIVLLSKRSR